MEDKKINVLAFFCNENGTIQSVVKDDFELFVKEKTEGQLLTRYLPSSNVEHILNFLQDIKQNKISLKYKLQFNKGVQKHDLIFVGISLEGKLLVIGAESCNEAIDFVDKLQEINNDQANMIRKYIKKDFQQNKPVKKPDDVEMYNEISKLNNDLVNLQRELTRKNMELERLDKLKNQFMGTAAHDIRNPLGIVISYTDFLLEELKDQLSEQHLRFLKTINDSADFMLNLVEELLDYSKIKDGKINLTLKKLDFIEQTRKVVGLVKDLAARKKIFIEFEFEPDELWLEADKYKLDQVLNNLLSNAIKFSHEETTVKLSITTKNQSVLLSVSDEGIGISADKLDKIFEPFFAVNKTGTKGEKSTGLGLSIVKTIIEAHQGKIWVESAEGQGTTFFVSLPKSTD